MINVSKAGIASRIEVFKTWFKKSPKNKALTIVVTGLLIILVISLSSSRDEKTIVQDSVQSVAIVQVTQNGFDPAYLSVKRGTKVVWTSKDDVLHRIAANPHPTRDSLPGLYSEVLNQEQSYEYTFNDVGIVEYHDEEAPTLNATIEVTE